jgi:hypothetical protein
MAESAESQAAELFGKQHPRTPVQINQAQPCPLVGQIGAEGRSNARGGTGDYDRAIQNFHGASFLFACPQFFRCCTAPLLAQGEQQLKDQAQSLQISAAACEPAQKIGRPAYLLQSASTI